MIVFSVTKCNRIDCITGGATHVDEGSVQCDNLDHGGNTILSSDRMCMRHV